LREVCDMIINGSDRNRQCIKAPAYVWREAMLEMYFNEKISRPLKSHGYLLEVVQSKLTQRSDIDQSERAANRRNAEPSRVRTTSIKPIGDIIKEATLPNLPDGKKGLWMEKATADLIDKGMKKQFIIAPLVEQRAKEMYADSQS